MSATGRRIGTRRWLSWATRARLRDRRIRFACVLGEAAKDCGPAALATVARHYGSRIGVLYLHELLHTDLQGTDLRSLRQGAERLGFEAACGVLTPEALGVVALPLIAYVEREQRGHFVVVHRVDAERVVLADPARGIVRLSRDHFLATWSGQVLLLRPSAAFARGYRQNSGLIELARLASGARDLLWPSFWMAAAVAALAYALSLCLKLIVDQALPDAEGDVLRPIGIGLCAIVAVRVTCGAARQWLLVRAAHRMSLSVGLEYVQHILGLPMTFFDSRLSGEVFARFLDAPKVVAAVTGPVLSVLLDALLLLACGTVMLFYDTRLTLVAVGSVAAVIAVGAMAVPVMKRRERTILDRFGRFADAFVESLNHIRAVKSYSAERSRLERITAFYCEMQDITRARAELGVGMAAASSLVTGAASVYLLWVGAQLVIDRRLTMGELMFFYSIFGLFVAAVERLAPAIAAVEEALVGLERLRDMRLVPLENAGPTFALPTEGCRWSVELRDVSFWYRAGRPVLSSVSLRIEAGETVVFLGETGSGKSTLVSLLNALYLPNDGQVLINGRDTRELDVRSLRQHLAIVLQEPGLMNASIGANIAFGAPDVSLTDLRAAAAQASADEFISALPKGYDHEVGQGGAGLSSGQRQRIAIARALLRKPPILILDEATSNLDPETEAGIVERLHATRRERITIVSTHRISIAARADRIVVLQHGRYARV